MNDSRKNGKKSNTKYEIISWDDRVSNQLELQRQEESKPSNASDSFLLNGLKTFAIYNSLIFGITIATNIIYLGVKNFSISSGYNFAAILSVLWIVCAATTIMSSIIWLVNAYNEVKTVNDELGNKKNITTSLVGTIIPTIFSILGFLLIGAEIFEQAKILILSGHSKNVHIADTLKYIGIGFFGLSGVIFLITLFFLCKPNNQKNEEEVDGNENKSNAGKKISPRLRNTLFALIFCFTSIGFLFFFNAKIDLENFFKKVHGFNQSIDATFALIIGFLAIGVGIFISDVFHSCYTTYLVKRNNSTWIKKESQIAPSINIMIIIFSGVGVILLITNIITNITLFTFGVMMIALAVVIKCSYPENNGHKYKDVLWNNNISDSSNVKNNSFVRLS